MKRRDALKSLVLLGAVGAAPAVALAQPKSRKPSTTTTRSVFKIDIIRPEPAPAPVIDANDIRVEYSADPNMVFIDESSSRVGLGDPTPNHPLVPAQNFVMVKCEFKDLRQADVFCLYEETGELVEPENPVQQAMGDAYLNHGVWCVQADPISGTCNNVPKVCPA